jgi:hypothetical protein
MNENLDARLDRLFKTARVVMPDITQLEEGFEGRLMNRLHANQRDEAPLSFWTWRLAPVMTVMLFILVILNIVIEPQRSPDIFSLMTNGYEQGQVRKYLTGE